jgi:hypothetical protein
VFNLPAIEHILKESQNKITIEHLLSRLGLDNTIKNGVIVTSMMKYSDHIEKEYIQQETQVETVYFYK